MSSRWCDVCSKKLRPKEIESHYKSEKHLKLCKYSEETQKKQQTNKKQKKDKGLERIKIHKKCVSLFDQINENVNILDIVSLK